MTATAVAAGPATRRRMTRVAAFAGLWALGYALYRGYYAAGGTAFLHGTIRPGGEAEYRAINLAGAVIIGVAAVLPLVTLPLWHRRRGRQVLLALCWVVAVGCCMHAVVDMAERVLSLAGVVRIAYPPLWAAIDRRYADLQDLFFNEPWFLVEGLAYGALGYLGLGAGRARRWWTMSALTAIAALFLLGMATVLGFTGKAIIF